MLSPLQSLVLLFPLLQNPPSPAPAPAPAQKPAPKKTENKIPWYSGGLEAALAEAKTGNKLVFVDFNAAWCTWCMKMGREVFSTDEAASALEGVLCVSVDYDKHREIADRYLVSRELPVMLWFNSDGTVRERIEGSQSQQVFLASAARIRNDLGTINEQRRKVEANPADLDGRFELYRRLKAVGDATGAGVQRAAIEKADPQGNSRAMHHFKYDALMDSIHAYWATSKSLDPKQIAALREFLEGESDPEIMWDGWMSLSNTYKYWGEQAQGRGETPEAKKQRSAQREALAHAWRGIPQDDETLHAHVTGYAALFWDLREELSADDKALLLSMTEMISRRFENDALVQDLYARALFLSGKRDAAQAACEHAIEIAKARGENPLNYQKTLDVINGGAPK